MQQAMSLISVPLTIFNLSTTFYYLAVKDMPEIKAIFPNFWMFLVAAVVLGIPTLIALGFAFTKTPWFKAAFNINTKRNPYSNKYLQQVAIPYHTLLIEVATRIGVESEAKHQLMDIVEASRHYNDEE